jgi:hypothetical protein
MKISEWILGTCFFLGTRERREKRREKFVPFCPKMLDQNVDQNVDQKCRPKITTKNSCTFFKAKRGLHTEQ